MTGPTYALTTVVDVRSNSGARGSTSCDTVTSATSGNSSRTISLARSSCAGFTNEWRNEIAIDSTPNARSRAVAFRTASSSSGTTTFPSASMRSGTARRTRRRTIGSGAGNAASQMSSLYPRRMSISSRNPWLQMSPARAPFIWIIVLSPVVVPCTIVTVLARRSASDSPSPVREEVEPREHAVGLVGRRRRRLLEADRPVAVREHEVGEGAADVDADAVPGVSHPRRASSGRAVGRSRPRRPRGPCRRATR